MIQIVGDRPDDLLAALRYMADQGMALVVTSGGLGPTADDLTAEVVGRFAGREMVLDDALEERIAEILRPLMHRWPGLDPDAIRESNRKQAVVPEGATVLESGRHRPRAGRAAGVGARAHRGGAPRAAAGAAGDVGHGRPHGRVPGGDCRRPVISPGIVRLYGLPESEIANTLRAAEEAGVPLEPLEITTCLRRGEIEVATRYEPAGESAYAALIDFIADRHGELLFSRDGSTVDSQVASLITGA